MVDYTSLGMAIILQAISDLYDKSKLIQLSARKFLSDDEKALTNVCNTCGIDVYQILNLYFNKEFDNLTKTDIIRIKRSLI